MKEEAMKGAKWVYFTPEDYKELREKLADISFRVTVLTNSLEDYAKLRKKSLRNAEMANFIDWGYNVACGIEKLINQVYKVLDKGEVY